MAYCGEQTAVKSENNGFTAVSLRCRSWLCPTCTENRKKQLVAQGIGGQPNKFLTLTLRRQEAETPDQAARRLSRAWRLVRLRLMRHYKLKQLPFIAVMEKHKSGWPHLHILLRGPWMSQKLISSWMREICDGPIVWIEHLDKTHKAAVYCAKYCGKAAKKFDTAKRYWQSRDYDLREPHPPKPKYPPGQGWEMWPSPLARVVQDWTTLGYTIKWKSAHLCAAIRGDP